MLTFHELINLISRTAVAMHANELNLGENIKCMIYHCTVSHIVQLLMVVIFKLIVHVFF